MSTPNCNMPVGLTWSGISTAKAPPISQETGSSFCLSMPTKQRSSKIVYLLGNTPGNREASSHHKWSGCHLQCPPPPRYFGFLVPCNHEKADSRMILHLKDAVNVGYKKMMLRTADTDVIVLAVAAIVDMDIQVAFGTGIILWYEGK